MPTYSRGVFWSSLASGLLLLAGWMLCLASAPRMLVAHADIEHPDALVVLAGSSAYVERTRHAARLFREGRAPMILLTDDGMRGPWDDAQRKNPFFVERAADELRGAGVPAERIKIVRPIVHGTFDEAEILRAYATAHDLRSILLLTSAYHSRRALFAFRCAFRKTGVEIGVDPVPGNRGSRQSPPTWWDPYAWRTVGSEYVKLAYYWLHHGRTCREAS